jgi:molybdate transport system substrate-binding protein
LVLTVGCGPSKEKPVVVFAAASTREALEKVTAAFRAATAIPVEINLGSSADLARQLERGATADLFLSADEAWVEYLGGKGLVAERHDLLTNRLVVVVPAQSCLKVRALGDLARPEVRRLALAGAAVPAGRYAREALGHAGVWHEVRARVLEGGDVRAALTYVAREEAEAGIVYATDAAASTRVRVALEVDPGYHTPIRYPVILVHQEAVKSGARHYYEFLKSQQAAGVFRRFGFGVLS